MIPLGLTVAASEADAGIHEMFLDPKLMIQKYFDRLGVTSIISTEKMEDIKKMIESHTNPSTVLKSVSKTIENEAKEQSR